MLTIREIQGDQLTSSYAGQTVVTRGVVTGTVRRGFFIQTAEKAWDGRGSDAIYVYSPDTKALMGAEVEVEGECVNYLKDDNAKPITQIKLDRVKTIKALGGSVSVVELTHEILSLSNEKLANHLNGLEGMLVEVAGGATFIAPSNAHGDYVLALPEHFEEQNIIKTEQGGVIEADNPLRWFPGFRVTDYRYAQRLNVGTRLTKPVRGPLNYRVESYQIAVSDYFEIDSSHVELTKSRLHPSDGSLTVMTLNCFNLDAHVESASRVINPRQDVDDDWGEGRFHTLAQAIVLQANLPDIVALQEIQDNDGAELSEVVDASLTYEALIKVVEKISGQRYEWVDINPKLGEDGGQPGGNIRNGYLFNPKRVELVKGSLKTLGQRKTCFEDSRKPLVAIFSDKASGNKLAVINVHLASKRHQNSIFAPQDPGMDAKLGVRTEQAEAIQQEMQALHKLGVEYYVTGDFNDGENSLPMKTLEGKAASNLVFSLPPRERYDYNHRGKLQVLMHGVVPREMQEQGRAEYEIIHGNELIGVMPSEQTDKPSDHAYVIAKLTPN